MSTVTSHLPGTLCWLDLSTTDSAAARAFYTALFGWDYDVMGPEMGHYAFAKNQGRVVGGIGQPPPEMGMPPAWTPYLATEDAAATLEQVVAHGGKLLFGPMEIPGQGVQVVAMDAAGAAFGFWQPNPFPGSGVLEEPGALSWAEVNSRAAATLRTFYATIFGLETTAIPGGMEYYVFEKGGKPRFGALQMTERWGDIPPHWMVYFGCENTDAAVATVLANGGKVFQPPFDTPHGRLAVVADPQGAVFTLRQAPAAG